MDNFNMQNNSSENKSGYIPGDYYPRYQPEPKNAFAIAAMILGMCSLATLCIIFPPIPLGALGILFVILSKRTGKKLQSTAITGLVTSLAGIILSIFMLVALFAFSFNMLKPENRDQLNEQFEQIYGMDYEEYMKQLYGEDFENLF